MAPNKTNKFSDQSLDLKLRPGIWNEYIGQDSVKKNLQILLRAAKERREPIDHLLLHGPAGLGKTTLAHLIAKEAEAAIKITSGPTIERVGDLASVLTNLQPGEILFIDEIHRLNKLIEEVLYSAMESRSLNIIIGKGPSARTIQLELSPFTLIAATTRISLLSSPLRSRFSGGTYRLNFYNTDEIKKILNRSAKILNIEAGAEALNEIALRSRATPRISNHLLKRCRDYAQVHRNSILDMEAVQKTFNLLEIDKAGLEPADRRILEILITKFSGGPVGLNTLSAATSEEEGTIEEVYEPYLIQLGFIERTPRGRLATPKAYEHLGLKAPKQDRLL
ncbi:MAG: Holliday junction DNA helicase RuvB [Candidatus Tagabacteria bacterium RIFCSPLOWO2_01_FULL_42_9]|uniref:Holliday junction branch migration complex subunit RuvB n=1 Tax=Candidatus Tagabacteria bacterium RIFCSPLOWO2_01_FULL_42_9 TaxID=1802296 RepID=A0A1G2LVT3_9BACT|nr:MAG: Holliday junction DNA helicase RuvB [Candidatus Tagabacteria bacterium RIFCSPLOWO2_01_FULL_42_9]